MTARDIRIERPPAAPGGTVWFTGLSGAGKTTLADALGAVLEANHVPFERLDGDDLRRDVTPNLGFSPADREMQVRTLGFLAERLSKHGVIVLVSAIAPYRAVRDDIRSRHRAPFIEVFVDCPIDTLVRRDPKGLYAKALRGELPNFTGISAPYEAPLSPELRVDSGRRSLDVSVELVLDTLRRHGLLASPVAAPAIPAPSVAR